MNSSAKKETTSRFLHKDHQASRLKSGGGLNRSMKEDWISGECLSFLRDLPSSLYRSSCETRKGYRFVHETLDKLKNGSYAKSEWSLDNRPASRKRKWLAYSGAGKGGLLDAFLVDNGEKSPTCFWIELPIGERVAHVIKHHEPVRVGKNGYQCLMQCPEIHHTRRKERDGRPSSVDFPSLSWEEEVKKYEGMSRVLSATEKRNEEKESPKSGTFFSKSQSIENGESQCPFITGRSISSFPMATINASMKNTSKKKKDLACAKTISESVRRTYQLSHSAKSTTVLKETKDYSCATSLAQPSGQGETILPHSTWQRSSAFEPDRNVRSRSMEQSKKALDNLACNGIGLPSVNREESRVRNHGLGSQSRTGENTRHREALHVSVAMVVDFANRENIEKISVKATREKSLTSMTEKIKRSIIEDIDDIEECIREVIVTERMIDSGAI